MFDNPFWRVLWFNTIFQDVDNRDDSCGINPFAVVAVVLFFAVVGKFVKDFIKRV